MTNGRPIGKIETFWDQLFCCHMTKHASNSRSPMSLKMCSYLWTLSLTIAFNTSAFITLYLSHSPLVWTLLVVGIIHTPPHGSGCSTEWRGFHDFESVHDSEVVLIFFRPKFCPRQTISITEISIGLLHRIHYLVWTSGHTPLSIRQLYYLRSNASLHLIDRWLRDTNRQ